MGSLIKSNEIYNIAGRLTLDEDPGKLMKQLRKELSISQRALASSMGISSSVLSDYENGRRCTPGSKFIKKYVNALMKLKERSVLLNALDDNDKDELKDAILKINDFDKPVTGKTIAQALNAQIIYGEEKLGLPIYGYTVLDSIKAIISLNGNQFYKIFGKSTERALIFTQVGLGRSPMVAIRVSPLKPRMVILYGITEAEPLSVDLAKIENVIFGISLHDSFKSLISSLDHI